jgi:hypothetical protein
LLRLQNTRHTDILVHPPYAPLVLSAGNAVDQIHIENLELARTLR